MEKIGLWLLWVGDEVPAVEPVAAVVLPVGKEVPAVESVPAEVLPVEAPLREPAGESPEAEKVVESIV